MEQEPTPQEAERREEEVARRLLTRPYKPQKAEPKRARARKLPAEADRSGSQSGDR
jgi:hypothetical protein